MKNADLVALLKERGLPSGGKKADLVERLTQDDNVKAKEATNTSAPATSKPAALHPEDEIDWDDDEDAPATTESAKPKPTAEPVATAKAGGKTEIDNPQHVPNQAADIDPSKTADLSVKEPNTGESSGDAKPEEKQPTPDYTRGVAATDIDEEIARRKKRAERFGLNIEDDEGLKKLERAKKFGEGPPKGLDEALPERAKKRSRDTNDEGARGRDKRRGGGKFGGRRGRGDRRRDNRDDRGEDKSRSNGAGSSWMNEADRAKAEARKGKWS